MVRISKTPCASTRSLQRRSSAAGRAGSTCRVQAVGRVLPEVHRGLRQHGAVRASRTLAAQAHDLAGVVAARGLPGWAARASHTSWKGPSTLPGVAPGGEPSRSTRLETPSTSDSSVNSLRSSLEMAAARCRKAMAPRHSSWLSFTSFA
jgi:hypothetical protein